MMKRRILILVLILILYIPSMALAVDDNLIRLHVLANSDKIEDQEFKLLIRDEVLAELEPLANIMYKEEAIEYIEGNLESLQSLLEKRINENGFNYAINIELAESDFPTRKYQSMVLPAGRYLALKVTIGEGKGANWWCVLFPPICHGDWVQEPRQQRIEDSHVALPVVKKSEEEDIPEVEQGQVSTLKQLWNEYKRILLKVWSLSESP